MTHDDVTLAPNPEQDDAAGAHDAIGAYILGALPEFERIAFEAHLRDCPQCQQELRELGPIAALLPRLYDDLDLTGGLPDLEPSAGVKERIVAAATVVEVESVTVEPITEPLTIEGVDASVEAVAPEVKDPVVPEIASSAVDAAVAADGAAEEPVSIVAEAADTASIAAPSAPVRRPRGRIAPGDAPPEAKVVSLPRERNAIIPWALAAAAAILATGAILWALAMMGQIDDLEDERDLQDQQIAQMNQEREDYLAQTPALVYPLVSTTSGSSDASAMVYMDPDPDGWGGIVAFRGMGTPPSGQVYQLWMITDGQVTAGPTFMPDSEGRAMVQVGGDASNAGQMAITMEPDGGSETPTTSPIMQGNLTA